MITLEAIACGRPVVTYASTEYQEYRDFPLKDIVEEKQIAKAMCSADYKLWQKEYVYLTQNHLPENVDRKLVGIYETLI